MKFRSIWLGVLGLLMVQNTVSAQEQIDTTIREQRLEFFKFTSLNRTAKKKRGRSSLA